MWARFRQEKNWYESFYQMETVKEGETSPGLFYGVKQMWARLCQSFVLFCFVFVA